MLQLNNMVAFNHSDDLNKQIAVGENDIVHIPAPGTQKFGSKDIGLKKDFSFFRRHQVLHKS